MEEEVAIPEQEVSAELIKQQMPNKNYTVLSSKEFTYTNFILFSLVLNFGRTRPSWPRKALYAFTWKKITSILSYNQAASIYWVMIACQQHAVSTLWCRERDMQSREIDLGVIYILVREEALQADELSEKTGGEGKEGSPHSSGDTSTGGGRLVMMRQLGLSEDRLQAALFCSGRIQGRDLYKEEPLPQTPSTPEDTSSVLPTFVFSLTSTRFCFLNKHRR